MYKMFSLHQPGSEFKAICSHDVRDSFLVLYPGADFRWEGIARHIKKYLLISVAKLVQHMTDTSTYLRQEYFRPAKFAKLASEYDREENNLRMVYRYPHLSKSLLG